MVTYTTNVRLTDLELTLLDGHCSEKVQKEVNLALSRLAYKASLDTVPEKYQEFIARVLAELDNNGRLVTQWERIRNCPVCKKQAGYATYKRTSRYHRKGEKNFDRPLYFSGIELAKRSVRMKGSVSLGCCKDCYNEAKPHLVNTLKNKKGEIPEALTGHPPRWKWVALKKCKKCGWEGSEAEMGNLRTLMGDGTYPGQCPDCKVKSLPFGPIIFDILPGFALIEIKEEVDD